jgi:hypothetical protein
MIILDAKSLLQVEREVQRQVVTQSCYLYYQPQPLHLVLCQRLLSLN